VGLYLFNNYVHAFTNKKELLYWQHSMCMLTIINLATISSLYQWYTQNHTFACKSDYVCYAIYSYCSSKFIGNYPHLAHTSWKEVVWSPGIACLCSSQWIPLQCTSPRQHNASLESLAQTLVSYPTDSTVKQMTDTSLKHYEHNTRNTTFSSDPVIVVPDWLLTGVWKIHGSDWNYPS